MFCPSCGIQLVSDTPFCTQCGSPVKASAQAPIEAARVAPAFVPAESPRTRKSGGKPLVFGALVVLGVIAFVTFRSQAKGSGVETVRGGVLTNYNTTTVGKAFEGTFQNAKWTSFVSKKGVTVVQFDGTVSAEALKDGNFLPITVSDPNSIPVQFQFLVSADNRTFQLGYFDHIPFQYVNAAGWGAFSEERTLKFVYQ